MNPLLQILPCSQFPNHGIWNFAENIRVELLKKLGIVSRLSNWSNYVFNGTTVANNRLSLFKTLKILHNEVLKGNSPSLLIHYDYGSYGWFDLPLWLPIYLLKIKSLYMEQPFFSIVIPIYNKEEYILRALNSILNQSFDDFEVIIVNDGSTDHSLLKAQEIKDERIRIISQENTGPGAARNRGINQSNGKWIAFLDADDEYSSEYLLEVFNTAKEIKKAEVIYSLSCLKTEKETYYPKVLFTKPKEINYFKFTNTFYKYKTIENSLLFINSSCVSVRKNAFIKSGYFLEDVSIGEDTDTWHRLAWTSNIVLIPKILAQYNIVDGSSDHNNTSDFRLRLKSFLHWKNNKLIPTHLVKDSLSYINYCILWESYRLAVNGKKVESLCLIIKNLFFRNMDIILFSKVLIVIAFPRSIINTLKVISS